MNRLFFSFFIIISTFLVAQNKSEQNSTGYNKFYYENGIISSEGTMKEGKADGYWKNYYENGKLKNEGNRKNFLLDSLWKFYDEKGKLIKSYWYKEGKKNGFVVSYDTLGKPIQKEYFIDNVKSGKSYTFYSSGKTKLLIPFVNGKADGLSYEYNEDSLIISITLYKMGFIQKSEKINRVDENGLKQGIWKDFYPDGLIKSEIRYKNNEIDGYVKEFTPKGDLKNITKFNNGEKISNAKELIIPEDFKAYFENGNVRYEGSYLNKMPIGTHYYYRQSKKICDSVIVYVDTIKKKILNCQTYSIPDSALIYEDGYLLERGAVDSIRRKQGLWKMYYLSGELKGTGFYKDNVKSGEWNFYYVTGKIEQKGKYNKNGLPTGEWKWFYDNGNIRIEENYKSGKREGYFKEYLPDGKLITSGEYSDDLKEGLWYYEIANYKEKGIYRMGEPDSLWKAHYVSNNQLLFSGNFNTGDPIGKHTMYYENGKLMCSGSYEGGMKQGNWKYFEETGDLIITIDYENDIERKWNNKLILPTYEESLRAYEGMQKLSSPGKEKNTVK